MQAQSAGHASTLFLDELHRLVRRLESELDMRTSAAHEALTVLDRMKMPDDLDMYTSSLRHALSAAAGLTPEEDDALRSLSRDAERPKPAVDTAPPAPGGDSFEKAITRYDFAKAAGIASAGMRSGEQTPLYYMDAIYRTEALRRPEMADHLDDLVALLRGIRDVQLAADKARGRESVETEQLAVRMFDYLHTLVRLRLVTRATQTAWHFFLDLRGRFSFLTSDRQWGEYRDKVLAS